MNLAHIGFALLIITVFSSQALAQTSTVSSPVSQLKIGYVEVGIGGCGCSLALNAADLRKGRYVFIEDLGEPAYINLDGKDLKEGCEATNYKAVMTITRKTQKAIVKTIGLCGC